MILTSAGVANITSVRFRMRSHCSLVNREGAALVSQEPSKTISLFQKSLLVNTIHRSRLTS